MSLKARTLLCVTGPIVISLIVGERAAASSVLNLFDTSGGSALCDNSIAFSASNCGAGFITAPNSNMIRFSGTVGGFGIGEASLSGIQPNMSGISLMTDSLFNVTHNSGSGDLTANFAVNDFSLPAGQGAFLSASDIVNWSVAHGSDTRSLQVWGRS